MAEASEEAKDFYKILGIARAASDAEIKKASRGRRRNLSALARFG